MESLAEMGVILALLGLLVEVALLIVAGVWVVSKIRGTTQVLGSEIGNLRDSIDLLRSEFRSINDRQNEHAERIARIEASHFREPTP